MSYNPEIHHRRSVRLRRYDYTLAGGYFVTVCTFNRECLFGDVMDGEMRLNHAGEIVREEWLRTTEIRKEIALDSFVIMPNHLHGIVLIADGVGAHGMRPDSTNDHNRAHGRAPLQGRPPKSLGAFIAGFKSVCTTRINQMRGQGGIPVWQRNYYEHVIRSEDDLGKVRQYIAENPVKWDLDENNPANAKSGQS